MACLLKTWILLLFVTFVQNAPLIYNGNPFVLPESHPNIHLYLDEIEEPTNLIISDFTTSRPPKIYPLNPQELEELYLRLSKQPHKSMKYLEFFSAGKLSHWNKKCCDNEWVDYGAFGRYNGLTKPVFQLGYGGYPSNQEYRSNSDDVKPVTEHIEGDLKYDFRTMTHSI